MNIYDYIILSVLLIGVLCVILYLHRRKKRGLAGCSSCPNSASCMRSQAGPRLNAHSGLRLDDQTQSCPAGQKKADAHADRDNKGKR